MNGRLNLDRPGSAGVTSRCRGRFHRPSPWPLREGSCRRRLSGRESRGQQRRPPVDKRRPERGPPMGTRCWPIGPDYPVSCSWDRCRHGAERRPGAACDSSGPSASLVWIRDHRLAGSSEMVLPVGGHTAGRPGNRLLRRMVLRGRKGRAGHELVGAIVPEPVLPWLEAADDRVARGTGMTGGVLAGGIVATADVAALRTTTQVKPPSSGLDAFDTAGPAGNHARIDGS
jgi:hypothetical protein